MEAPTTMKTIQGIAVLVTFLMYCGCTGEPTANQQEPSTADKDFKAFSDYFVEELWRMHPTWATWEGFHKYDSVLIVPTFEHNNRYINETKEILSKLEEIPYDQLSKAHKTDYALMKNQLESAVWYASTFRSEEWNPSRYNVTGPFARILEEDFDRLGNRLQSIFVRLRQVPAYYQTARLRLKTATEVHAKLAISQNKGGSYIFRSIRDSVETMNYPQGKRSEFLRRIADAETALNSYVAWLENDMLKAIETTGGKSFRIGKDMHAQKFQHDINSGFTAEEVYQRAVKEKETIHQKMFRIGDELWSTYFPEKPKPGDKLVMVRELIDEIATRHVHRDSFIVAIERQLPELVNFVNEKQLVYLDPSKPLEVRETPPYMRGVAGASISSPGPYEKDANTYYNVTPLDDMTDEEAESYLREYNHYILQILNIHEAIPGHYTQLVYSNESPSLIKSILGNGTMVEGWACYVERMMLEEGYGNNRPEMWLMYYKWNLRIVCNTIIDYGIHSMDMPKEEVLDLLMNEAFQEKTEAEKKWKRAQLTQVQLCSYYTGLTEIYNYREQLKERMQDRFDLKSFHETFLSFGSAPVPEIRKLMDAELEL